MEQRNMKPPTMADKIQETLRSIGSTRTSRQETTEKADSLLLIYEAPGAFLKTFGPEFLSSFLNAPFRLEEVSMQEDFPQLEVVVEAFGSETALYWLRERFRSFTLSWAPSREVNEKLLDELSRIVLTDGMDLNTGEVCLFIAWLKAGKMGNLYDASPVRISIAFQTFLERRKQVRLQAIEEMRKREEKARRDEERRRMESPEYLESMVDYFEGKGDRKMAQVFRDRLAAKKGGDR